MGGGGKSCFGCDGGSVGPIGAVGLECFILSLAPSPRRNQKSKNQ